MYHGEGPISPGGFNLELSKRLTRWNNGAIPFLAGKPALTGCVPPSYHELCSKFLSADLTAVATTSRIFSRLDPRSVPIS